MLRGKQAFACLGLNKPSLLPLRFLLFSIGGMCTRVRDAIIHGTSLAYRACMKIIFWNLSGQPGLEWPHNAWGWMLLAAFVAGILAFSLSLRRQQVWMTGTGAWPQGRSIMTVTVMSIYIS